MDPKQLYGSACREDIEDLVNRRIDETLHLDFKEAPSGFDKPVRKVFAATLSSFANAGGGLIVWGVQAKANQATHIHPVKALSVFLTALLEHSYEAVDPPLDGIESRSIPCGEDEGFALTYVPPGEGGPYMAKLGENRYYKRNGPSDLKMEHYDIADMFGRRSRPVLGLELFMDRVQIAREHAAQFWQFRVNFALLNRGRGTASGPYLALRSRRPYMLELRSLDAQGRSGLPTIVAPSNMESWFRFGGQSTTVMYPGYSVLVTVAQFRVPQFEDGVQDFMLDYQLAAVESPLRAERIVVRHEEIWKTITLATAGPPSNTTSLFLHSEKVADLPQSELL